MQMPARWVVVTYPKIIGRLIFRWGKLMFGDKRVALASQPCSAMSCKSVLAR